jgi:hypothetical protein
MKRLLILLSSLIFACATRPQIIEKEAFVKCPVLDIPKTERPIIKQNMTYPEKLKPLLDYMFKLERENEILKSILDTCK